MADGLVEIDGALEKKELNWRFSAASTAKYKDRENQDACSDGAAASQGVFVVCDGVGGKPEGAKASKAAKDALVKGLVKLEDNCTEEQIQAVFNEAAVKVLQETSNGATTAVAVIIRGGKVYVASVGDSIAAVLRDGSMVELNKDKDILDEVLTEADFNGLSDMDKFRWSTKNYVGNALCRVYTGKAEISTTFLLKGDVLLLETDGVFDNASPSEQAVEIDKARKSGANIAEHVVDYSRRISIGEFGGTERKRTKKDDITMIATPVGEDCGIEIRQKLEQRQISGGKSFLLMPAVGMRGEIIMPDGNVFSFGDPTAFGLNGALSELGQEVRYLMVHQKVTDPTVKDFIKFQKETTYDLGRNTHLEGVDWGNKVSRIQLQMAEYNGNLTIKNVGGWPVGVKWPTDKIF